MPSFQTAFADAARQWPQFSQGTLQAIANRASQINDNIETAMRFVQSTGGIQMHSLRNTPNAFTVSTDPFSVGGVNLPAVSFQVPQRIPRLPPAPPRGPGGSRLPIPIPIPIPTGGIFQGERKKRRRMNPLNPKALRRALRRVDRFEDFVNKTASLTGLQLKKRATKRRRSCR